MAMRTFLSLIFVHICIVAFPQAFCIKGTVNSEDHNPIEFANVALSDREGNILKGSITDSLGCFSFSLDSCSQMKNIFLRVSHIGYESHKQLVDKEDLGIILLHLVSKELKEVVVTGKKSPYTMKAGTLTANIQNSILKDAGSAMDVLKQLPLVNIKNDIINIFGKGNAQVYINNKELHSIEELLKLSSKRIKKIEIITTPGAQYSSSAGAVVKISTTESAEGFSGLIHTRVQMGKGWSESLLADAAYATKKFSFFADYSMQDIRKEQTQQTYVSINGSSPNLIYSNNELTLRRRSHNLGIAAEYRASEEHLLGVKYSHSFLTDGHYKVSGAITAYSDSKRSADYNQKSNYYPDGNTGNVNVFYKGKVSEWNIDLNSDYMFGHTKTLASYDNTESINNKHYIVNSNSKNNYRLGAIKLELSRKIKNSTILFGTEYVKTRNQSFYSNDNRDLQSNLPQTSTLSKQDLFALFLNYKYNIYHFDVEMGLRFEFINQRYYINERQQEDQTKKYSNIFPTLVISRSFFDEKINMSLSYRRVVNRPSYYQLRGDIQYNSPYSYEVGNPLLKNTYIDDINYTVSYSNLNFMASYKSYHNKTLFTIDQYENKAITMSGFTNVDGFKKISIASVWDPTFFKVWNPEVEIGFEKQFLKLRNKSVANTYNRPYFYVSLYNILKLPLNYSFVVQAKYWTSYNSGVSYEYSGMFVDAFIQKYFMNKKMVIKIGAENIFNTSKEEWEMMYNSINFKKRAYNDNRFIYLSFTYNFHNTKKYAGKGTRNSEQRRLNTL